MQSHVNVMSSADYRLEFLERRVPSAIALDPAQLSRQNDLWRQDMEKYGPWKQVVRDPSVQGDTGRIWQSRKTAGEVKIVICGACSSAMDVAWELSQKGLLAPWDSVVAVSQQSGRGQRQRIWKSPAGNLYAAWCWPGPHSLSNLGWDSLYSLIAGYLAADVLVDKGLAVQIKWPNDLLINGRKTGGILLEQKDDQVVVGIGLNIESHPEDHLLRDEFAVPATSLKNEALITTPLSLWLDIVSAGKAKFYQIVESLAPAEWTTILNRRLAWIGKRVRVNSAGSSSYEATIKGLAQDGGLELQAGSKTNIIYTGSLTLV